MLGKYKCHKEVEAGKIFDIVRSETGFYLSTAYSTVDVSWDYFEKHNPKIGGYYVKYEDGYESWSPAEAFEEGYTLVEYEVKTEFLKAISDVLCINNLFWILRQYCANELDYSESKTHQQWSLLLQQIGEGDQITVPNMEIYRKLV